MRRDPLPWILFLLLALAGGIAWLTRHPESPILDRMVEWPLMGPAAERFRALYRPPPPAPAVEPEIEIVVLPGATAPAPGGDPVVAGEAVPRRKVWVRAGTELRGAPEAAGEVVEVVPRLTRMELVGRSGDWYRLSRVVPAGRSFDGWAPIADLPEPSREELWQPEPVLPLPAVEPAPELLAVAHELLGRDVRESACGPYRLFTDVDDPALTPRCARLAEGLDRIYRERFGLRPVSGPAGAILVFRSLGHYLIFRSRVAPESRRHAFAAPARGVIALAAEGRVAGQLQATLVHELNHLLNRRALGPALPPWLEEGLAEELAISRFDEQGRLVPGTLGGWEEGTATEWRVGGGRVAVARLRELLARDRLPTFRQLVALDQPSFQQPGLLQTHYTLSAWWVRHLLRKAPAGGHGFQSFLDAVARGEPLSEELLLGSLGADWEELERDFRGRLSAEAI